ncbi:MAG: hypothetical protein ACP5N3_02135 [Candidatus Nanoarchaeia archaeon]
MKKLLVLLLLIVFVPIFVQAQALTCQYKETVKIGEKEVSVLYVDGDREDNALEIENFKNNVNWQGQPISQSFEVHNSLDVPLNVTVEFIASATTYKQNAEIAAHSFGNFGGINGIEQASITFIYNKNNYSEGRWKTVDVKEERCVECPEDSGFICLNDNQNCSTDESCGGGYCIDGLCTSKFRCSNDEVTCANGSCVVPNSVALGQKPICSVKECTSNYVSSKTGECSLRIDESCQKSWECESNNCVEGKCASLGVCPSSSEFCSITKQCVSKNVIREGVEPTKCNLTVECAEQTYCSKYNLSTCITKQYLDVATGFCAEHPEITSLKKADESERDRLQKEKSRATFIWILVLLIVLILLMVGLFFAYKKRMIYQITNVRTEYKEEKNKQEKLKKETANLQKEKDELKKTISANEQAIKEQKIELKEGEKKLKEYKDAEEKIKEWEKIDLKGED